MAMLGTPATIRDAVRERYGAVAREPGGAYNFRVGREFAEALGYPAELLDDLPPSACEAFTGVATVSLLAQPAAGDTVVDLGSGGGLDLAVLAQKVGPDGRVVGVDFAPDMVARARRTLEQFGVQPAEVREADADHTGLPDAFADYVTINGLLNLSMDKRAVLAEIARILRPGGRLLLAETTLHAPLPQGTITSMNDWFR